MDPPQPSLYSLSLVTRAKTALQSAAVRAEKVLTDIKADLKIDRDIDVQSQRGTRRSTDRDIDADDDCSRLPTEVMEKSSSKKVDSAKPLKKAIPSSSVIKQLALAIESSKHFNSVNSLLSSAVEPSNTKEKNGLSFSAVKSLVLRDKEDNEINSSICRLFKSEEQYLPWKGVCGSDLTPTTLLKDLHGAPPGSFVVELSVIIGGFKSLQKMASFWCSVIAELRKLWSDGQPIPRMPLNADPDLNSCLLHQQFQVINCSIARKQRRSIAEESLHSILTKASHEHIDSSPTSKGFARTSTGDYVLRLGISGPSENLTMLETGEPIYSPITQEGPVLTEELIKETEEFVLRTGSLGPGCSQLLSDMQAFKAANPGCILEDFIRWYSPPDWMETDNQLDNSLDDEGSSRHGQLSRRMQEKDNLWHELWETAKALPAVKQTPLFDEDLAVESILTSFESIQPSDLFEQLAVCVISAGLLIAEAVVPEDGTLNKKYNECKDYIVAIYQSGLLNEKLDDICKVYGTIEAIVLKPEETTKAIEQPDETPLGESKKLFKVGNLNFVGKDKQPIWKRTAKDDKKSEEKQGHVLSSLFDKRTSLFSKKSEKLN
ncbi:rab3 GTPase-activating protein catalytic subunit-like [Zingiber officinale]|uniref:rab3 GTPase-activating protein catalytic subunit-like n=1 Tax=Zingiber officinale TaxID=94328 RepID=UPI001C4AB9C6|nr:rab3 GTPase-activating protein catalytic subunit-like [Zingiber officinale]